MPYLANWQIDEIKNKIENSTTLTDSQKEYVIGIIDYQIALAKSGVE